MAKNPDFVEGDVVSLKSGGHKMTVDGLTKQNGDPASAGEADLVKVSWLTDAGDFKTTSVKPTMLDMGTKNDEEREAKDDESKGSDDTSGSGQQGGSDAKGNSKGFLDASVAEHGMSRTISPYQQSHGDKEAIHTGDDRPQSLGNLAESQPAQEREIQHTAATTDYENPVKTVKQDDNKGKGLPGDDSIVTDK